jgi:glycerophosphoryl diester phosphodiesterase
VGPLKEGPQGRPAFAVPAPRSGAGFLIVAHRGNRARCPENSAAAFSLAIEEGADVVETDLRPSRDGVFVCFHDSRLERMSTGRGHLETHTLEELASLRLRFQGLIGEERIPTLETLVGLSPSGVALALELKSPRFVEPEISRALARDIGRLGIERRTVVLSFRPNRLKAFRREAPGIPSGCVCVAPWGGREADLLGPLPAILLLHRSFVRRAHRRGQLVCPLDARPERRVSLYRQLGVDALLADDPASVIAAARSLKPD